MNKPPILVVDDDLPILALMKSLLREFGFEPATAASGEEALRRAGETRPALVLLDKNMPGMSCDEVIGALREREGMAEVPILILSGEPLSAADLVDLGANGAILKPFDVPALVDVIKTHIAQ